MACNCGDKKSTFRVPRFGLGQFSPVGVAVDVGTTAGLWHAGGMGPVDWFMSTATDLIYNARGKLSPGQEAAQIATTNQQIRNAANAAKSAGADPATIDAIAHDAQAQTAGLIRGALGDAAPDDNNSWLLWLALAGLAAYFVFK